MTTAPTPRQSSKRLALAILAGLLWTSSALSAQTIISIRSGMVYAIDGEVEVDGKQLEIEPPFTFPQLKEHQPIVTRAGRAEVLLTSQSALWLDVNSRLSFEDTYLESTVAVLENGKAMVEIPKVLGDVNIQIRLGPARVRLTEEGLYRFEYDARRKTGLVQVLGGRATVTGADPQSRAIELKKKKELTIPFSADDKPNKIDQFNKDGLHWWAAFRSWFLDWQAYHNGLNRWNHFRSYLPNLQRNTTIWPQYPGPGTPHLDPVHDLHSEFDVRFGDRLEPVLLEHWNGQEAGLLFHSEGDVTANGVRPHHTVPPFLPDGAVVQTGHGRAEVLLGTGVAARLDEATRVRFIDHSLVSPALALDQGVLMVEVAQSTKDSRVRIQLGDTETTILEPGLYRFDEPHHSLSVWGGKTSTSAPYLDRDVETYSKRKLDFQPITFAVEFDTGAAQDDFFNWCADRSFFFYQLTDYEMVDWEHSLMSIGQTNGDLRVHHPYYPYHYPTRGRPRFLRTTTGAWRIFWYSPLDGDLMPPR